MAGAAFQCVTSTALREHREISGTLPVDQGFGQFHEPKKRGRISSRKRSARKAQRHERPSDRPAEFRQKNKNTHTQPSQSEIAGDPGRRSVKAQPSKRASNREREREARVFLPTQEDRVGLGWEAQRNAVRSPPSCSPAVWESPAPAPPRRTTLDRRKAHLSRFHAGLCNASSRPTRPSPHFRTPLSHSCNSTFSFFPSSSLLCLSSTSLSPHTRSLASCLHLSCSLFLFRTVFLSASLSLTCSHPSTITRPELFKRSQHAYCSRTRQFKAR